MAKKTKEYQEFKQQKYNASIRGIPWELNYQDWKAIWEQSGKKHLRGCGKGKYCMARFGDNGPYSKNNVFIHEFCANSGDYKRKRKLKIPMSQFPILVTL